jgi:hypothetical protein
MGKLSQKNDRRWLLIWTWNRWEVSNQKSVLEWSK